MPRIPQGFLQDKSPDGWTAVDNTVNEGELRRRDMHNDKSKRRVLPVDYSCIPESKDRAFIVIDDPVKDKDDVNKEIRREALRWYYNSKETRRRSMPNKRRVLPIDYSCMPTETDEIDNLVGVIVEGKEGGRLTLPISSSPRAARRLIQDKKDAIATARDLLLSSLLSISAVPVSVFPEDEQKTVLVTLKEITERIRGLRKRLS